MPYDPAAAYATLPTSGSGGAITVADIGVVDSDGGSASGTAAPGAYLEFRRSTDNVLIGSTTANATTGAFTISVSGAALTAIDGQGPVDIIISDGQGNTAACSIEYTSAGGVQNTLTMNPIYNGFVSAAEAAAGVIVSGLGPAGSALALTMDYAPGVSVGSTTVAADGTWSATVDPARMTDSILHRPTTLHADCAGQRASQVYEAHDYVPRVLSVGVPAFRTDATADVTITLQTDMAASAAPNDGVLELTVLRGGAVVYGPAERVVTSNSALASWTISPAVQAGGAAEARFRWRSNKYRNEGTLARAISAATGATVFKQPTTFSSPLKLTNNSGTNPGAWTLHQYSRKAPWNADNSLIFLPRGSNVIVNNSGGVVYADTPFSGEYTWHTTDPDVMFGCSGTRVQRWKLSTNTLTDLFDLGGSSSIRFGSSEGEVMADRYAVIDTSGSTMTSVDLQTGTVLGTLTKPPGYDWAGFCCSGQYIVCRHYKDSSGANLTADRRITRYSPNFTGATQILDFAQHIDFIVDEVGDDWIVLTGYPITAVRIRDGLERSLGAGGGHGHLSRAIGAPGYVFGSIENDIVSFSIQPGGWDARTVWGQHNSTEKNASGADEYVKQPKAAASNDGRRIMFTSDQGSQGAAAQDYVITGS